MIGRLHLNKKDETTESTIIMSQPTKNRTKFEESLEHKETKICTLHYDGLKQDILIPLTTAKLKKIFF